jgi:uncharacterized protein (TIGR02145 family)
MIKCCARTLKPPRRITDLKKVFSHTQNKSFNMKKIISIIIIIILIFGCKKSLTPDTLPIQVKPLFDIDGNGYDTVKIDTQLWMKQNLTSAHYRNGDPIPEITSNAIWSTLTTGAWCWYNNDSVTYAAIYGKLYNWYAVNDSRGLAPYGYHIPSVTEWVLLSSSLGGDIVAGGKMKETGTTHWSTPNTEANNSSGFTGLPGGFRTSIGTFYSVGTYGGWWSSSESTNSIGSSWYFTLGYNFGYISKADFSQSEGFSVRCIRN